MLPGKVGNQLREENKNFKGKNSRKNIGIMLPGKEVPNQLRKKIKTKRGKYGGENKE